MLLEEWLPRIPEFELAEDEPVVVRSGKVNAITHLPLRWTPECRA